MGATFSSIHSFHTITTLTLCNQKRKEVEEGVYVEDVVRFVASDPLSKLQPQPTCERRTRDQMISKPQ